MHPLDLHWLDGPALPQHRWSLADGFTIGRAPGNSLVLPDAGVSREHARVRRGSREWTVEDCASRGGVHLNGLVVPAAGAVLHAGDRIAIGPWRFGVERAAAADVARKGAGLAEQRLELLLRCAAELAAADDEHALADVLAENALAGSGFARAAVFWSEPGGAVLRSLRPVGAAAGFRHDPELLQHAARAGQAQAARSLCLALALDDRPQAWLYLDGWRAGRGEAAADPTYAHALARLAAFALANLRRVDSAREHAMLAADLERARDVQRRLLPGARAVAGLRHALHLQPGRAVAGDIADVFELAGGKVAALLGDVAGAGLGAGLLMASVQSFLRAELAHHDDPARAATRLNAHLCEQSGRGRFVTLWLGIFDPAARACRFVDAGHGLAWRLHPQREAAPIAARGGIPLGVDAGARFHAEALVLDTDEFVLLHSDGLTERRAADGSAFGGSGLAQALRGASAPREAVSQAIAAAERHAAGAPADDDITVLALAP